MLIIQKDSEIKLAEMLNSIHADTNGWRSVHCHFSGLKEQYKNDYQTKISINVIRDFVKEGDGGIFCLGDRDIVILCKGVTKAQLDKMIFRLRYLFADDPVAYNAQGEENPRFCTLLDLTMAWREMFSVAKDKLTLVHKRPNTPDHIPTKTMSEEELTIRPLTPARLMSIEKEVATADLSKVMRRQAVCAMVPGKPIRRVFDEFYINIAHLRKLIMANVDFVSNRALFTYLTQILDGKMLELLRKQPAGYFDTPISLNLNVDTLLSEQFASFNAVMKPAIKVSIVIEIQIADVFADMHSFLIAKEAVQKMGYRVCLDGVSDETFALVSREKLGFDLMKVQWGPHFSKDLSSPKSRQMAKAIEECGASRLILCWCDTKDAIDFGQHFGISLFQGRHLDAILNPDAKVIN